MHSLLEQYLEEVTAHLAPLPIKRRDEEIKEMRQHLLNAFIVNREMGQSEDEAVANAVEQFGAPEELGKNVAWAWRRERARDRWSFWKAVLCVLGLLYVMGAANSLLHITNLTGTLSVGMLTVCLSYLRELALMGAITGLFFPRRAVEATKVMVALLYGTGFCQGVFASAHPHIGDIVCMAFSQLLSVAIFGSTLVYSARAGRRWREGLARD